MLVRIESLQLVAALANCVAESLVSLICAQARRVMDP
jgi:hypothetical protein